MINKLILFISIILVVAIAASVLIQTGTSLQNKALATGNAVRRMVSTNAVVMNVDREQYNDTMRNYKVRVKVVGDGIKFEGSLLTLNDDIDLNYVDAECNFNETTGYNESTFSVRYPLKGSRYQEGYLFEGDIADLCFLAPRIRSGLLVPQNGIPTRIFSR